MAWLAWVPMGLLLLASVWTDVRGGKIPNRLIFTGLVLGILVNTGLPDGLGFSSAMAGAAVGLAVMLPMYLLRVMGAGDVKLMAMVGAFLGLENVLGAVLGTFIAGGVLSLAYAWKIGVLRHTLQNIRTILYSSAVGISSGSLPAIANVTVSAGKFPYAVAVTIGTLGYLVWKIGLI